MPIETQGKEPGDKNKITAEELSWGARGSGFPFFKLFFKRVHVSHLKFWGYVNDDVDVVEPNSVFGNTEPFANDSL